MASYKFKFETASERAGFQWKLFQTSDHFSQLYHEINILGSPFAIVLQENTAFAGGGFLNYQLFYLLHGNASEALLFLRAQGSICMQNKAGIYLLSALAYIKHVLFALFSLSSFH